MKKKRPAESDFKVKLAKQLLAKNANIKNFRKMKKNKNNSGLPKDLPTLN